jgi:hypothetical protein
MQFLKPLPPPPPPRPWRDVEQERIRNQRNMWDPANVFGGIAGLAPGSVDQRLSMLKPPGVQTGDANMALARDKGVVKDEDESRKPWDANTELAKSKGSKKGEDKETTERRKERVRRAGNLYAHEAYRYNEEMGGYKWMPNEEFEKSIYSKRANSQMKTIRGAGGEGVWVAIPGITSLTGDNATASQSEVWARMSPWERKEYLNSRFLLRALKEKAPNRWRVVQHANNIAVQGQYRWINDRFLSDKSGKVSNFGGFYSGDLGVGDSQIPWSRGPGFTLFRNIDGTLEILTLDEAFDALKAETFDPHQAGMIAMAMLNGNFLGGATANFSDQYIGMDPEGRPIAAWQHADWDNALRTMVANIASQQSALADPGANVDDLRTAIENTAKIGQQVVTGAGPLPEDDGGGGGGFGGFGGGGGGFFGGGGGGFEETPGSVFLTDPTALGEMVDSIARARLGRVLTPAEKAAFIEHFHRLQTEYSNAYNARDGGTLIQPDMEGQAVAWIESYFMEEQVDETEGELISALAAFIRGPGLGGGGMG